MDEHFKRQFGDFIDNQSFNLNVEERTDVEYFCLFCDEKFADKSETHRHYQSHLDYYPVVCQLCNLGLTDLESYQIHHEEFHPTVSKKRFRQKEQSHIDKWISGFLYSQATTIVRAYPAREQCPVCEFIYNQDDIEAQRPRRCTINRKIDHVHRHLCYLPYECIKCKESGSEFLVAYFESKAHSHIKQKHPEIDDDESRWHVFQKTVSIPKLDEFVKKYLSRFGISMEFERRPIKKNNRSSENSQNNEGSNVNDVDSCKESGVVLSENKTESSEDEIEESLSAPLVVNVTPLAVPPATATFRELYFCLFCSCKFHCKTDAYPHYGQHLDYLPVVCKMCVKRFSDIDSLMMHYKKEHENSDISYDICEDQVLMKWVDDFLESQVKPNVKNKISCPCINFCPVCVKQKEKTQTKFICCQEHNDIAFSDHVHQHLLFFPYECSFCKKNGKIVRVTNLDTVAMNHVKEHNINNATMYQLCKTFPKTLKIPKLEKFIGENVSRKRMFDKKENVKFGLESQARNQHGQAAIANFTEKSSRNLKILKLNTKSKIKHVRVENGRIKNLPPLLNGTKSNLKVQCLNCKQVFQNRKLLAIHHQKFHQGISINMTVLKS